MKVFISWSGERSRLVAELLNSWLQCVLQAIEPWLSSKDIDRGALWFTEITNQLSNTHNGIVCLTKSNLNKPWILFEAGALAKGLSSNRVYTLLIDLNPADVKDPLAQFNHTLPTKEGIHQLIRTINRGLEPQSLKDAVLSSVFETYWPQFENEFTRIVNTTPDEDIIEERPQEDVLNEILFAVRGIEKRLRKVEEAEYLNGLHKSYSPTNNYRMRGIEELDLSVRAFNVLKSKRINTIDDLLKIDLESIEGIKSKEEIRNIIEQILNGNYD